MLEERIQKAVALGRRLWVFVMITAVITTIFSFPFWYAIFLIPFGVMSYFGMMFIVFMVLRESVTSEEMTAAEQSEKLRVIHEKLDSGELEQGSEELLEALHEAGLTELQPVKAMSEEIIGHIDGQPMHEWIEMVDPTTKKVERFAYFGIAQYDPHGVPLLPDPKGKVYAHVNGVVYARDLQPV